MKCVVHVPRTRISGETIPRSEFLGIMKRLTLAFGAASVEGRGRTMIRDEKRWKEYRWIAMSVITDSYRRDEFLETIQEIGQQIGTPMMWVEFTNTQLVILNTETE